MFHVGFVCLRMQVSLPHYRSTHFLKNAVTRYQKFLHLKRVAPDTFLVPCYDFDLVWHAHQLHPLIYRYSLLVW